MDERTDESLLNHDLKSFVLEQFKSDSTEYLRSGGSGAISIVVKGKIEACLKINRLKLAKRIEEIFKLFDEINQLLKIESIGVLPVLKKDYNPLTNKERKTLSRTIDKKFKKETTLEGLFNAIQNDELANLTLFSHVIPIGKKDKEYYFGFLTPRGVTFENALEHAASKLNNIHFEPDRKKIPDWYIEWFDKLIIDDVVIDGEEQKELAENNLSKKLARNFIIKFIENILGGLRDIHDLKYIHLDIKEANILLIQSSENPSDIRYAIFDFGSAKSYNDILNGKEEKFYTTFQYLPDFIQKKYNLTQFTSHVKVPIWFKPLETELSFNDRKYEYIYALDLHALSCILFNLFKEERYRRVSAHINYDDFESTYSFAQFISFDFKNEDKDSQKLYSSGKDIVRAALDKYQWSKDLRNAAIIDWSELIEGAEDGEQSKDDDNNYETNYNGLKHPASFLYCKEQKELETIYSENQDKNLTLEEIDNELDGVREEWINSLISKVKKSKILIENTDFITIINTKIFKRLKGIRQLALTYKNPNYHGTLYAMHRRYEHSIGTLEIAWQYLVSLLINSGWFRLRYEKEDGLYLLTAALLHDVGHYPYAHYLEDTNIFPGHMDLTNKLLLGDLYFLNLNDQYSFDKLAKVEMEKGPNPDVYWTLDPSEPDSLIKVKPEGLLRPSHMRFFEIEDVIEFYTALNTLLCKRVDDNKSVNIKNFWDWYRELLDITIKSKKDFNKRLICRVFDGLLSGPIDVDKVHYIVNDSLNCKTSLASSFEKNEYNRLLKSLRIPIKYKEDSGTLRFCLGLNEGSIDLAQFLMFIRSAMFTNVYWSESARSVTVMLKFLILECFRIFKQYGKNTTEFIRFIGEWVRGNDDENTGLIFNMINPEKDEETGEIKGTISNLLDEADRRRFRDIEPCEILNDIYNQLFGATPINPSPELIPRPNLYRELCKIYPNDTVAYFRIQNSLSETIIPIAGGEKLLLINLKKEIINEIRTIIGETLNINLDDNLKHGTILVDFPNQSVSKTKEFVKFSVVNDQGYGRPVGKVWDAIENDFAENTKVIRIFIKPDIIKFDREDSANVRTALITRLS